MYIECKVNMSQVPDYEYRYTAFVDSVYDGDTITCTIDCGFGITLKKQKIRLYGINTKEVRGEERAEGLKVRDILRDKILGQNIELQTIQDRKGKYGRYLGIIIKDGVNLNDWLVDNGHAERVDY